MAKSFIKATASGLEILDVSSSGLGFEVAHIQDVWKSIWVISWKGECNWQFNVKKLKFLPMSIIIHVLDGFKLM
jgi:hypothetical protein